MIDPNGNETWTTYDSISHAHPEKVVQFGPGMEAGLELSTATQSQVFGVVKTKTDANGSTTRFENDRLGK